MITTCKGGGHGGESNGQAPRERAGFSCAGTKQCLLRARRSLSRHAASGREKWQQKKFTGLGWPR